MKKKILNFTAAMLVFSALLTGCGGNAQNEVQTSDYEYTGVGPITDVEGAKVSILAQNSYYATVDVKEAAIVKKVQEDAGIELDWTLVDPTSYNDAVSPMLAAGTGLSDIILMPDQDENMTYIKSGLIVKLDEYFDEMPNFKNWLDANPIIKASLTAEDGHIYYVPSTNVSYNYQPALMYNNKWLADAGFNTPKTLDDFVEVLRYYKDNDMNGNGDVNDEIPMSVQASFLPYMFGPAFGLDLVSGFYVDDNGDVSYAYYEEENYKAYLTFLNKLYTEGLLELEYTTLNRDQVIERFAQDRTGITFDFGWQQSMTYSPQLPYYDGTPETGVVAAQPLSGPHEGFYVARNSIGTIFGVNANSNNIVNAVRFLDYAINEDNQEMYVWGIEGESFVVNSDGEKEFTEQASDNEWLQQLGVGPSNVYPARQSVEATNALVAKWHGDIDAELVQYMRDPWPFIYSTSEEASMMSQYMVDIQTYVDEMGISFVTGTTDLSQFDNYIETLKTMKIDDLITIKADQYERFKTAMN